MTSVYVLVLHGDTTEPYESYPTVELLKAFTSYPTKGDVCYALKNRFPDTPNVVKFANRDEHSFDKWLYTDYNRCDYYANCYRWEIEEVGLGNGN